MPKSLEVCFRGLERSEAIERNVRDRAVALERFGADLISCRVTVELPHKHHRQGNLFAVTVHLQLAHKTIDVHRHPPAQHTHEDAFVAIRDAFAAAVRQLEDYLRVRRGDVKNHALR